MKFFLVFGESLKYLSLQKRSVGGRLHLRSLSDFMAPLCESLVLVVSTFLTR